MKSFRMNMVRLCDTAMIIRRIPLTDLGATTVYYDDIISTSVEPHKGRRSVSRLEIVLREGLKLVLVMRSAKARALRAALEEIIHPEGPGQRSALATREAQEFSRRLLEARGPTIRNLLRFILDQAIAHGASDLHWEFMEHHLTISMRVDGMLFPYLEYPKATGDRLVSALKVASGLHHYYRDSIQEGRLQQPGPEGAQDLRVSVIPAPPYEKIAVRMFDKLKGCSRVTDLGFAAHETAALLHAADSASGLHLICGPSSSGKSTTLYALARHICGSRGRFAKVLSIEDPIEYRLQGITQVQVSEGADLTYAKVLMSSLRQDIAVFLVGEIRDRETAEAAVQAALTGHLVFATLHCGSAPEAIARLHDLGVKPAMMRSTLRSVLCQRLVRMLCPACGGQVRPEECPVCRGTGYRGRTAIGEILEVNDEIGRLILREADTRAIEDAARSQGMVNLRQAGNELVSRTATNTEEIDRVL